MAANIEWRPFEATAEKIIAAQDADSNPFTGEPFSGKYKDMRTKKKLPVTRALPEFLETFQDNQMMLLAGPTGSGKSTQTPQFAAYSATPEGLKNSNRLIVCTQPRRLACESVSGIRSLARDDKADLRAK